MKFTKSLLYATYLILFIILFWSFYSLLPRTISSNKVGKNQFSTERALIYVKEISKQPHFVGSKNHQNVRNYIASELIKLGLKVEIQKAVATNIKWQASATVYNILARIPGENHSNALMLLSHYDSSPSASFGASDDGSGVATILEGVRAFLSNGKKPKNDIIILISDGEELGLLGAKAFVKNHPWAKEVKLVINFEARGSGGSSYMLLETNQGNKNYIDAFSKANNPFPVSNSIAYSIYKNLPNDTDLTVFREDANIDGYNFAFIDDHFDYHTAQDSYNRLDRNSLEHQGTYLMAMLTYFSENPIDNLKSDEDDIFFNIAPFGIIHYPFSWIKPLFLLSFLLFFLGLFIGFKRSILNKKDILLGFIPFLVALIVVGLFTFYGWKLLQLIYPQYGDMINKFTYNGTSYIIAFSAISISIFLLIYQKIQPKNSLENKMVAPLFFWLLLSFVTLFKIVGASYVVIPLLMGLLSFYLMLFSSKIKIPIWFHAVLAFPLIMLFAPFVHMLPVALGLSAMLGSTLLLVLMLGLLLPVFIRNDGLNLKLILLILGVLFLVRAHFQSTFNEEQKKPNTLVYLMNIDENTASWMSYDQQLDSFTEQYLSNIDKVKNLKLKFKSKFDTPINFQKNTELLNIAPPSITILSDSVVNYQRTIKFLFLSNRDANKVELIANKPLRVYAININGDEEKKSDSELLYTAEKNKTVMSYYFVESEPLFITLTVPSFEECNLSFYETKFDLLNNQYIVLKPRAKDMMPKPYVTSDATIVVKSLNLSTKMK